MIGDKMTIKNMKDAKKIKDIFINEKVPVSKRKTWPIVVDSKGNVLWLPGLKKSQFDSQKSGKYDIILKYYVWREKIWEKNLLEKTHSLTYF